MGKSESREQLLTEMASIIKANPGIRPSKINQLMNREHTASLRNELIKRMLVKKRREGSAVRYYPIE